MEIHRLSGTAAVLPHPSIELTYNGQRPSAGSHVKRQSSLSNRRATDELPSVQHTARKPIVVAPYSEEWPLQFAEVHSELLRTFSPHHIAVEHIGSTSVPGLSAKPVIDVLAGADSVRAIEQKIEVLERIGYKYVARYEDAFPMRRYFVRAADSSSRVNLHAVVFGSQFWVEHLAFRDALRSNPSLVSQYQELKERLAVTFKDDRQSYTEGKATFIQAVIASALRPAHNVGRPSF